MRVAGWTLVSGDAFNKNSQKIVKQVLKNVKDKSIIVMHFGTVNAPGTEKALPLIVQRLKKRGFDLTTLDSL